jgi:hypothetical protein
MLKKYFIVLLLILISACAGIKNEQDDLTLIDLASNKIIPSANSNFSHYKSYKNWTLLYSKNACALISYPLSSYGSYVARNLHYIYINYNKAKGSNEIAIIAGKTLKENEPVKVELNNYMFLFQPIKDVAWANNETRIISEMLNLVALDFLVYVEFADASYTIDKYSIEGFKDAFSSLRKMCL